MTTYTVFGEGRSVEVRGGGIPGTPGAPAAGSESGLQAVITIGQTASEAGLWTPQNDPQGMLHANGKDIIIPEDGLYDIFVKTIWSTGTAIKSTWLYRNLAQNPGLSGITGLFESFFEVDAGPASTALSSAFLDVRLEAGDWIRVAATPASGAPTWTGRLSIRRSGAPFG